MAIEWKPKVVPLLVGRIHEGINAIPRIVVVTAPLVPADD
jgi:hypothetical protein